MIRQRVARVEIYLINHPKKKLSLLTNFNSSYIITEKNDSVYVDILWYLVPLIRKKNDSLYQYLVTQSEEWLRLTEKKTQSKAVLTTKKMGEKNISFNKVAGLTKIILFWSWCLWICGPYWHGGDQNHPRRTFKTIGFKLIRDH